MRYGWCHKIKNSFFLLTLTKKGIINMTKASSTLGSSNGDKMKSFTFSQKSICMKSVMHVFTIAIRPTYKQHCAIQAFMDGGFPYSPKLIASQPFLLDKYWADLIPTNIISKPRDESSRKLMMYLMILGIKTRYYNIKK